MPDDPQEREAFDQRYLQQWAASNAKLAEVAKSGKPMARMQVYAECSVRQRARSPRQKEAADLLTADQTVPQGRIDFSNLSCPPRVFTMLVGKALL